MNFPTFRSLFIRNKRLRLWAVMALFAFSSAAEAAPSNSAIPKLYKQRYLLVCSSGTKAARPKAAYKIRTKRIREISLPRRNSPQAKKLKRFSKHCRAKNSGPALTAGSAEFCRTLDLDHNDIINGRDLKRASRSKTNFDFNGDSSVSVQEVQLFLGCWNVELSESNNPVETPGPNPTETPSPSPTESPTAAATPTAPGATPTPYSGMLCTTIEQYGITWTLNEAAPCGQFVSGDWWVVGPVTVTSVSPAWDGIRHGSMVNPNQTAQQGYDSRAYGFSDILRTSFPATLNSDSSLISVKSLTSCTSGGANECLSDAAVLTVLSAPPAANSFRPPYFGNVKLIRTTSEVDYELLPRLSPPAAPLPSMGSAITRVWLDHGPNVSGAVIHPNNNMPPYPRDSSILVSRLAVLALLDTPSQQEYANRLIQLGLDLYSISLANEGGWRAQGGFGSGRKWPIIFAGILLNDLNLKYPAFQIANGDNKFGEDGHTYYGQPTVEYPDGKPLWGANCAIYGQVSPWFGNHDCRDPDGMLEAEQMINGGGYRICCTSHTWVGAALAAELLDAKELWGNPAFFDYVDRWTNEPSSWSNSSSAFYRDIYGYGGDGGGFMEQMWETYHQN